MRIIDFIACTVFSVFVQTNCWHGVNPRPGGGLSHLRHGRGVKITTPPNSKTKRDRKGREKRSIALDEYFRKYYGHFFVQVNIEVTRGHQMSNLAGCHIIFFSGMCYYLRMYYRYRAAEKAPDSPFKFLSLACNQN